MPKHDVPCAILQIAGSWSLTKLGEEEPYEKVVISFESFAYHRKPLDFLFKKVLIEQINIINLPSCSLTEIPNYFRHMSNVTQIDLSGNRLTEVPECIKFHFPNLRRLNLSNNALRSFWFVPKCSKVIEHLDLNTNRIEQLPYLLFVTCEKLQFLDLSKNPFRNHKVSCSEECLRSLKSLRMENCAFIDKYQVYLRRMPKLKHLDISNNTMCNNNPNAVGHLQFRTYDSCKILTEINLSGLGLPIINDEFIYLTNLTRLDLSNNNITEIPVFIATFRKLKVLNLSKNSISIICNELTILKRLEHFYLADNCLSELPGNLGILRIRVFDVYNNYLTNDSLDVLLSMLNTLEAVNMDLNFCTPEILQGYTDRRNLFNEVYADDYRLEMIKIEEDTSDDESLCSSSESSSVDLNCFQNMGLEDTEDQNLPCEQENCDDYVYDYELYMELPPLEFPRPSTSRFKEDETIYDDADGDE